MGELSRSAVFQRCPSRGISRSTTRVLSSSTRPTVSGALVRFRSDADVGDDVADGPLASGWQAWYAEVQDTSHPSCGEASSGDSTHVTSLQGASMSLQFYGV